MEIIRRFVCWAIGHDYYLQRVFSDTSIKIGCHRCRMSWWGMSDRVRPNVPWDGTFVDLYKTLGQWPGHVVDDDNCKS